MIVLGFFVWLCFGMLAAGIANSRGINGCAGFAWGVLLGPIGIIIVCVLPGKPIVVTRDREVEQGPQRLCPFCRSFIPQAAQVCRYCQRDLPSGGNSVALGGAETAGEKNCRTSLVQYRLTLDSELLNGSLTWGEEPAIIQLLPLVPDQNAELRLKDDEIGEVSINGSEVIFDNYKVREGESVTVWVAFKNAEEAQEFANWLDPI